MRPAFLAADSRADPGDYIKFCAPDQASLEEWASTLGDVKHCRTCFRKPATGSNRDATRG